MLPLVYASISGCLPVGFSLSPTMAGPCISTYLAAEHTIVDSLLLGSFFCNWSILLQISLIKVSLVPQHPPIIDTPKSTNSFTPWKNSLAVILYTVWLFSITGKPAFAWTITGTFANSVIIFTIGKSCFGPREQFTPRASTPNPSIVATIASGKHPVKLLPFSSNVIVHITGRFVFSFAARTATLAS